MCVQTTGQLATSATLWILNKTEMKLLSGVGFFIVWLMASAIFAVLGVRYRFAAFGFLPLLGRLVSTLNPFRRAG